jgi:hypothetical protein
MKTLSAICFFLAAGVVVPACGGLTKDYCEERCSCEDCSDIREEACTITIDASEDVAAAYGCDAAYEANRQCEITRYTCVGGSFKVEIDGNNPCAAERDALNRCIDDGSGIR